MRYLTAVIVALLTFTSGFHFNAEYDPSIDASQTKSPDLATAVSATLIEPVVSSDAESGTEPDVTTSGAPIEAVGDSSGQPARAQDLCEALKEFGRQRSFYTSCTTTSEISDWRLQPTMPAVGAFNVGFCAALPCHQKRVLT